MWDPSSGFMSFLIVYGKISPGSRSCCLPTYWVVVLETLFIGLGLGLADTNSWFTFES